MIELHEESAEDLGKLTITNDLRNRGQAGSKETVFLPINDILMAADIFGIEIDPSKKEFMSGLENPLIRVKADELAKLTDAKKTKEFVRHHAILGTEYLRVFGQPKTKS